ncbi:sulfurtransferase TusA family protein [Halocatena halophila]|uniref:sulfurtransferase TusA family protein n=1 Tax=Halocatena halophila TaxID=2814576 RepID=UPI002ED5DC1F
MARVDVRDEVCPRPALLVRDALETVNADELLIVRGDFPPAKRNLKRLCSNHGFGVTERSAPDGEFELQIKPTGTDTAMEAPNEDG